MYSAQSERIALGVIVLIIIFVAVAGRRRYDAAEAQKEKMGAIIAELGRLDREEAARPVTR